MDIEKKGALRNIMRGLFVSERQGDVVSSISMRDVSTLFSKSYEYEEYVEQPIAEEVPGVSRNTVQNRYSKIGKTRRLEKVANDILKTLLDLRTFENNKREYEDALRNYHSIVEARRHKEIMEVFQKEINNETFRPKQVESKSSKSLLLGGLALGAVALLLPLKSFAKEIEDELNEKDLNKQIDDLNSSLNQEELERQFSEFDDLPDEIPDQEETRDEELKLDNDLEKATTEIEKLQTEIEKTDIPAKEEIGVSRSSATSTTRFGRIRPDETPVLDEITETGVSTAASRQVTPVTETGTAQVVSRQVTPTEETGTAQAASRQLTPVTETGLSTAASRQVTPVTETGTAQAVSRQVSPTEEIGTAQSRSRNRVGFARLRPDESAISEVSPNIVFGGFPYRPSIAEEKPPATVSRVSKLESIDELKRKIGRAEGGEKIGYNAINVPVIKNPNDYDKETRRKIYTQLFKEAEILRGNIDATTGKKFDKNLSEMNIEEVIELGKRRLNHYKSFKYAGKPVDLAVSSAAGQYGFTMAAIEDNASKLFGVNWKKELYSLENQEKMQSFLMKSNILRFEEKKLPISEAFLYMKHFFGPYSDKPLQIVNAKDEEKMSNIMTAAQRNSNPTQAAMTVKQYKEHLIKKGFSFDLIDTKKLITEEERRTINLKPEKTTSDVKLERNTGQRVGASSTENRDARRQVQQSRPAVVIQNNNNTVINNRNTVNNVSAPRQQNNNPNMRQ